MTSDDKSCQLLIDLLREAAQVEHTLLCAYLYAACSLKSLPDEFLLPGRENPLRARQFETVRVWKQSILIAAREEMRHLHYVQCLLRTLDAPPCFQLPARNPAGHWSFSNWKEKVFRGQKKDSVEVDVPITPLSIEAAQRFVLYESGDWLQAENPFGPEVEALLQRLYRFERDLNIERVVRSITDATLREKLKDQLKQFRSMIPVELEKEAPSFDEGTPTPQTLGQQPRFTSISDLYLDGILPLFDEAFELGWVKRTDDLLVNELQEAAAGGPLTPGAAGRGSAFQKLISTSFSRPIRDLADVEYIINEIVVEGEGVVNFQKRAELLLAYVAQHGLDHYSQGVAKFNSPIPYSLAALTPEEVEQGEKLRNSHIYRFAMILAGLRQEAAQVSHLTPGEILQPARQPIDTGGDVVLNQLTEELPKQFNACYLVLQAWLSRMYEGANWNEDAPKRRAIEQLTTWPLMSMAIRPMLELASFLPVDLSMLFRPELDGLPELPVFASQLLELWQCGDTSQAAADRMDLLAGRVLAAVAVWASNAKIRLTDADIPDLPKQCILTRLGVLSNLDEFERQFEFRRAGGYSNVLPNLTYTKNHPDAKDLAEDPFSTDDPSKGPKPLFVDAAVLRLRFSGWALLQMATDFDPPTDEAGCTGSTFLHASDTGKIPNYAMIWQAEGVKEAILREPRSALPPIGVSLTEASLLVTDGSCNAGYQLIANQQDAISGGQQPRELSVKGLLELSKLKASEIATDCVIQFNLLTENGRFPHHVGQNHVVWQDGEAVDPFILAVQATNGTATPELLFQRQVVGQNLPYSKFSPLQRAYSSRWVVGRAQPFQPPPWVPVNQLAGVLVNNGNSFLAQRVDTLATLLSELLDRGPQSQAEMDTAVSLAERIPLGLPSWIAKSGHYGHTISGILKSSNTDNLLFSAFANHNNVPVRLTELKTRDLPNQRWLTGYALGALDLDALACFVYGELWIPVSVQVNATPLEFRKKWGFPAGMAAAAAAFACNFSKPFWGTYEVTEGARTTTIAGVKLTETLRAQTDSSYSYVVAGVPKVDSFEASITLAESPDGSELEFAARFHGEADAVLTAMRITGKTFELMKTALAAHFTTEK